MNSKVFVSAFIILSLLALASGRFLQNDPLDIKQRHMKGKLQQQKIESGFNDPFAPRPQLRKPTHKGQPKDNFPSREESAQIYKPFQENEGLQKKEKNEQDDEQYDNSFNELLKWSMLAGTGFLICVLLKTCMRKKGRREARRVRQGMFVQNQIPNQVSQQNYQIPQQQYQISHNYVQNSQQQNIDERIQRCQMELNKLKQLKQEQMRVQFQQKKIQEQIKRRQQMINHQRKQNYVQPIKRNQSLRYGPQIYGYQNLQNFQRQEFQRQPFEVKGVEPIRQVELERRQRSNSFRTQVSEQPIIKHQIKYRNGIPIGKPVRQNDNDSSFASEYPEV